MNAPRTRIADFVRLLNASASPLYVLDDALTVVFINRSCRDWLGEAAAAEILGQPCVYRSASDAAPASVAAGLCPPPQIMAGETLTATVCRVAEDGSWARRKARFVPLGGGNGDIFAIVAVLETADCPPDAPQDIVEAVVAAQHEAFDSAALHDHIRKFRMESASQCRFDRLIGRTPAVVLARTQAELAAAGRANVLLVGPNGSGRRHLAAAIHYAANPPGDFHFEHSEEAISAAGSSPKSSLLAGELATLDCPLLGNDLFEAAAPVFARLAQRGELATACTLLLHRIDELSAEMQTRLADYLAKRPFKCRLAATAASSLTDLARRGQFNAELAAMLSTITIFLPPLAERREDLPLLAQMFLEECNTAERQLAGFSPAALNAFDAYAWPGNVAELAAIVAESHRRASGPLVETADLPDCLKVAAQAAAHPRRVDEKIVLDEYLAEIERELIRRALARAKGNKARAARLLGVTRPRLYRRMVQLGLE